MRKQLLIDTATDTALVALIEGLHVVALQRVEGRQRLSAQLASTVQHTLQQAGWTVTDLNEICVGMGPGSYTGIRAGVALGQSMAYALNIACRGISTLCLFAPSQPAEYLVMLDARAGGIYCMHAERCCDDQCKMLFSPVRLTVAEAHQYLLNNQLQAISPHAPILETRFEELNAEAISVQTVMIDPLWVAASTDFPQAKSIIYADNKWQPAMRAHTSITVESLARCN